MTRDPFTLLRGRGETTTHRKKDQTKGKAFTVMLGEESALMQDSAVLKLRDFSICVCRITSHTPRAFVQASLLSSTFNGIHFWTEKRNKKLDKNTLIVENGPDLSYTVSVLQKSFSVPELNSETCSIHSLNISDSWFIVKMHKVDWKKGQWHYLTLTLYFSFPPVLISDSTIWLSSPLTAFQIAALMTTWDFWLQGERCITNERHSDSNAAYFHSMNEGETALFPFYHTDVKCTEAVLVSRCSSDSKAWLMQSKKSILYKHY